MNCLFMVTGAQPTLPLDVIEAMWLVIYPDSRSELIGFQALALAKHAVHVEEMREKVTKENFATRAGLEA